MSTEKRAPLTHEQAAMGLEELIRVAIEDHVVTIRPGTPQSYALIEAARLLRQIPPAAHQLTTEAADTVTRQELMKIAGQHLDMSGTTFNVRTRASVNDVSYIGDVCARLLHRIIKLERGEDDAQKSLL